MPSDLAVLDTELRDAGVSPSRVHVVTVGFNGPQALLAGRIAAFTGFIPDEGVTLQASGHPITAFGLDQLRRSLPIRAWSRLPRASDRLRPAARARLRGGHRARLRRHAEGPRAQPEGAAGGQPDAAAQTDAASLQVYLPLFADDEQVPFGTLQSANVAAMSKWMLGAGLIHASIAPARYGTNAFLP